MAKALRKYSGVQFMFIKGLGLSQNVQVSSVVGHPVVGGPGEAAPPSRWARGSSSTGVCHQGTGGAPVVCPTCLVEGVATPTLPSKPIQEKNL